MINKLKFALIFCSLPVLFYLNVGNAGLFNDSIWRMFQTITFWVVFSLSLIRPSLRKYFFIVSGCLIALMSIFFIFGYIDWSDYFGSSGYGLVVILLVSYLPQLLKLGYIKKI